MQWPHCHHPLTQPKPPLQLQGGRITPPSLWEPAGPVKRDSARQQVDFQCPLPSSVCQYTCLSEPATDLFIAGSVQLGNKSCIREICIIQQQ